MEFNEIPFNKLLISIIDNRGKTCPVESSGIPLIATNCIRNDQLYPTYDTTRYVSNHTYHNWFRGHPAPGDMIFVTKGSPGRVCWTPNPVDFCIAQDMVAIRANPELVYPKYLFALLRSRKTQEQIENMHVGTLIPHFKKGDFDKLLLLIPKNKLAQKQIGDFYFEITKKIELNRQINQILEQMVSAIFKSWFVDFEPTKAKLLAKIEGRNPLHAFLYSISGKRYDELDQLPSEQYDSLVATYALFPDEFMNSELGDIPRGWKVTTIGNIAEHCGGVVQTGPFGSQLHASDYIDNGLPVVMPQDIAGRRIRTDKIARIGEEDARRLSRHRLQIGDIVFSRRGDVEKHALVSGREQGWLCGTGCLLVRLGPKWPAPAYVSQALDLPASRAWLRNHAIGATMPNLNTGILSSLPLVIATESLVRAFQEKVDSIDAYINYNNAQSETLEELRDALLPKLLSGELPITHTDGLE